MKREFTILDVPHVDGGSRRFTWRTLFCALFMLCAFVAGACSDDDNALKDDPDPVVPEEPTPDEPDDPDGSDKTLRDDATPLFLDAARSAGITLMEIDGEPNGYTLTIDGGLHSKCFIPTVGLKEALADRRVKLVFEYRCSEPITQFNLSFSDESRMAYLGRIESDVDRFEDGWAPYSVSLVGDVDRYQWGESGDWLGFYLYPTSDGTVTFDIRDIYLEVTDEPVGPVEPEDPNKYQLSFSSDRASTPFEEKYGRADGIEFTRNGDEYHVTFVESHYDPASPHNEHMFQTDPLTRILNVLENQKVELVFKYKASTANLWQFTTYLEMNASLDVHSGSEVDNQAMKASADAAPDAEGWATYRHDLTAAVKKFQWGTDPTGLPQIRFRFRLTRTGVITDPAHPERYDFKEIDLKDIHLQVSDAEVSEPDEPENPKAELSFADGPVENGNTSVTKENGVYRIKLSTDGTHGEHFALTEPLTQALSVGSDQKVELVFTYKTPTQEQIDGNDEIVANDKWQFTTYFNAPYYNGSEANNSDMKLSTAAEEWIAYRHDLTQAVAATKWGTDPAQSQIRFRIRLTRKPGQGGGNPQCPEMFGFNELQVKDVYLQVSSK